MKIGKAEAGSQSSREDGGLFESVSTNDILRTIEQQSATAYRKKLPEPSTVHVIDFFAGCGGMSHGFSSTRQSHVAFNIVAGIDIDERALLTYEANVPGSRAICADIFEIGKHPETLRDLIPEFDFENSRPLVFIGCAPCQGFSAHRKKDERDDVRNTLMMAFAKVCDYYRPDALVMENVPEIITGKYSKYFNETANSLETSGYTLSRDVLDLSLYGVPQRRRRAIVFGSRKSSIEMPKAVFSVDNAPTVREAIGHLQPIDAGATDPEDALHRAPKHTPSILERIRKTPPDGGDRRSLAAEDQLECHSQIDKGRTPGFTDVYGRLRWDTPSVTITAKSSTPSCGRFLHPEQHRNISVREAAILQGFPQSYRFRGPFVNQYRQIGEAVPPLFARFLAWQILDHLKPRTRKLTATDKLVGMRPPSTATSEKESGLALVDGFCGAGGIGLGFATDGWRCAHAFDLDVDATRTFSANVSPNVELCDVADTDLVRRINASLNQDDFVLAGGPPCQGFSQQRRGSDDDPRNNLVLKYAKLARSLKRRPLAVILENVTYLDSPRGRKVFDKYVHEMEAMNYKVFRHDMNSASYEVPQLRRRIVMVAVSRELANYYDGPRPLTATRWTTVGEALDNLPAPATEGGDTAIRNHVPSSEGPTNKRRIAFVDMGGGRLAIPEPLQLDCHTTYGGHLDVYGRLDWFSQARTITGGFDSFTRGEFAHPFRHRSVTHREAARIQGFPDWFVFHGNRAAVRHQIGNAVPPPMAYAIARALRTSIVRARRL